jgi:hypothetical protein
MAVAAACSDADSSAAPTTSIPPAEAGAASSTTLLATPEPTGVPGLDSPDPFCAAWATYAGTVQSLGIAASFGDLSSVELAGLELIAAPHVVEVGEAIDSTWPQDGAVAAERATVIDQRIGPYVRRAQRAVEALTAAGVTKDELSELSALWQLALSERDPQQPVIDVPGIRPDLQTRLDEAAVAYDRDVTPFAADPSLTTDHVAAPTTEQYLAEHCPDLASSGVGDSL